jgi:16S rRNA processing protein RimM
MVVASTTLKATKQGGIVGKITSVFGIKGWVKIHSFTASPAELFNHKKWYLVNSQETHTAPWETAPSIELSEFRAHGKGFVAHFKGVDDRDKAALLCQKAIWVETGTLPDLPEGDYYWQQLIGLNVISCFENQKVLLGKVGALLETGANDVLEVVPCEGSIDKRQRLLPFVLDIHVKNVDLQSGVITVDWDPEF